MLARDKTPAMITNASPRRTDFSASPLRFAMSASRIAASRPKPAVVKSEPAARTAQQHAPDLL